MRMLLKPTAASQIDAAVGTVIDVLRVIVICVAAVFLDVANIKAAVVAVVCSIGLVHGSLLVTVVLVGVCGSLITVAIAGINVAILVGVGGDFTSAVVIIGVHLHPVVVYGVSIVERVVIAVLPLLLWDVNPTFVASSHAAERS